jgi:hypothetical protein
LRADVFAAFLDALRYPGSYDLFEQEGELFIVPVDEEWCSLAQSLFRVTSITEPVFDESVREKTR